MGTSLQGLASSQKAGVFRSSDREVIFSGFLLILIGWEISPQNFVAYFVVMNFIQRKDVASAIRPSFASFLIVPHIFNHLKKLPPGPNNLIIRRYSKFFSSSISFSWGYRGERRCKVNLFRDGACACIRCVIPAFLSLETEENVRRFEFIAIC